MEFFNLDDTDFSEKEKKILTAAVMIFSKKGYSAATTNEIARKAGIAEGTIFRYFKTKKHILHGLLIQLASLMADKVAIPPLEKILSNSKNKSAGEILKEIIIDRLNLLEKHFPLFKVVLAEALFHEDIREIIITKITTKLLPMFESFYLDMCKRKRMREVGSGVALRFFASNIMMFAIHKMMLGTPLSPEALESEINTMLDVIMNGIGA